MATATIHALPYTCPTLHIPTRALRDLASAAGFTLQAAALAAGLWLALAAPGLVTTHASTVTTLAHR